MTLVIDTLLALGLAAAFGGAVAFWRRAIDDDRQEELRAMAARRGWSLHVGGRGLGRAGTLRLASRGGHAWAVEMRADGDGVVTAYEADSPVWPEGTLLAVKGPVEPKGVARALGPELARMAQGLVPVPGVEGALLLSDADPSRRMILGDLARVLAGWSGPGRPVLALSPEGLRLTLRGRMDRASRMEAFVDLAFDLSRVIGP